MQHPINPLNEAGLDMLCDQLTEFTVAYENLNLDGCMERVERILPSDLFNELRAYLGSMRDHISVVTDLLYGDVKLLVGESLAEECPICDPESPDACKPRGIIITDEVAQARMTWWQHNGKAERLAEQLQRGLITRGEFEAAMAVLNSRVEGGAAATTESAVG